MVSELGGDVVRCALRAGTRLRTSWLEIAVQAVFPSMLARLQLSRTSCDLPATLHKISLGSPHLFLGSTASLLQRFTLPSRFCRALRDVVDGVAPAPPSDRMESAICMSGLVGVARDRFAVVDQRVRSSWDTCSTYVISLAFRTGCSQSVVMHTYT